MKKILFAAVAALLLTACSKNNTFTINGSFNLPDSYELGDTIITMPEISGYVYLCGIDGQPLDSCLIENKSFTFTGLVDPEQPYFAYLVSEFAAGMFVIEPGEMEAVIGEPVKVTGTPTNDVVTELMDRVDQIGGDMYYELQSVQESKGDNLVEEDIAPVYARYSNMVNVMIDSLYQANTDNLIGVYCANVMTIQAQSSSELEQMVEKYSAFVRENELIQQHIEYLRKAEKRQSAYGEDNLGD